MTRRHILALSSALLGLISFLVGCTAAKTTEQISAEAQAADLPNVKGKQVQAYYRDSCSGCHAPDRRGATGAVQIRCEC